MTIEEAPVDYPEIVHLIDNDPVVQTLLELPLPMRLAYLGLDGHPRSIPITHLWDGKAFVFATPTSTYKVRALRAHPQVGFSLDIGPGRTAAEARVKVSMKLGLPVAEFVPLGFLGRGIAEIEIVPGLAQVHVEAARRMLADDEKLEQWAAAEREYQKEMAVISIKPTHVRVIDFVTRFPPPAKLNHLAYSEGGQDAQPIG
jgi:hypothetical protein